MRVVSGFMQVFLVIIALGMMAQCNADYYKARCFEGDQAACQEVEDSDND